MVPNVSCWEVSGKTLYDKTSEQHLIFIIYLLWAVSYSTRRKCCRSCMHVSPWNLFIATVWQFKVHCIEQVSSPSAPVCLASLQWNALRREHSPAGIRGLGNTSRSYSNPLWQRCDIMDWGDPNIGQILLAFSWLFINFFEVGANMKSRQLWIGIMIIKINTMMIMDIIKIIYEINDNNNNNN